MIILDSGAYSAWSKGIEIDLDEYAEYALEVVEKGVTECFNLDVIPATRSEVDSAAAAGWENYLYLKEDKKLPVIPVFHLGESWEWLSKYVEKEVEAGTRRIGLGFSYARKKPEIMRAFIRSVFDRICDSKGFPFVSVHGLGINSPKTIRGFPWGSIDSASWSAQAGYGIVAIPIGRGQSVRIKVGRKEDRLPLGKEEKRRVSEFFRRLGLSFDEIAESRDARMLVGAHTYSRLDGTSVDRHTRHGLFKEPPLRDDPGTPAKTDVYLAGPNFDYRVMRACYSIHPKWLFSFHFLRKDRNIKRNLETVLDHERKNRILYT